MPETLTYAIYTRASLAAVAPVAKNAQRTPGIFHRGPSIETKLQEAPRNLERLLFARKLADLEEHDRRTVQHPTVRIQVDLDFGRPIRLTDGRAILAAVERVRGAVMGIVVDPGAERLLTTPEWLAALKAPADLLSHTSVHHVADQHGNQMHTHGLTKFGAQELMVRPVPAGTEEERWMLLMDYGLNAMGVARFEPGDSTDYRSWTVRFSRIHDRDHDAEFLLATLMARDDGAPKA